MESGKCKDKTVQVKKESSSWTEEFRNKSVRPGDMFEDDMKNQIGLRKSQ